MSGWKQPQSCRNDCQNGFVCSFIRSAFAAEILLVKHNARVGVGPDAHQRAHPSSAVICIRAGVGGLFFCMSHDASLCACRREQKSSSASGLLRRDPPRSPSFRFVEKRALCLRRSTQRNHAMEAPSPEHTPDGGICTPCRWTKDSSTSSNASTAADWE